MAEKTGVPKLKGTSNCQQWYTRLKTYMIARATWPAVLFVPKEDESQVEPDKPESELVPLPFDIEAPEKSKLTYHPKNDEALHHVLAHCEDGPASKIRGIQSAREAVTILMQLYGTKSEVANYILAEKLWTTTYESAGSMDNYTELFMDTWNEIQRRQITLDFLIRALLIYQLGSNFESFQHRKRETGIERLSFEDIISQLKQEDLVKQRTANIALTTRARNTCQKCQKPGHSEDDCWKDITCKYCKKKGHPEDRCHKKKENQDQGSAVAGSAVICA